MIKEAYTVVCDLCGAKAGPARELASQAENEALRGRWISRWGKYLVEHICPKCQKTEKNLETKGKS